MTERLTFSIRRQPDGSWIITSQPPLPFVTTFITGWKDVEFYRDRWGAVDHFPNSADYYAFCREYGEPPFEREEIALDQ
jgi:hypothetical protein